MKMFKVDRIINLAQRTVQIVNHTGNGDKKHFKKRHLEVKVVKVFQVFWIGTLTHHAIATKLRK
ncbi:hypothetical protein EYF80_063799 [Liparis tanakae]|uniref:Uncharacterized protein n=1 Tax=Liparis tanakae TaxID=230148 RepID=A0A4Z2EBD9_9TELE|nr:hypothetical protein EYF80_063799 [Liparis tanakae]